MMENEAKADEKRKSKSRHKELIRTFSLDDADFIAKNRAVRLIVLGQLPVFAAFDPALDTTFTDAWLLHIQTCENRMTDETMRDELEQKTAELQAATATALQLTIDLEYYVHKAFPLSPALWDEFGFKQRSRISSHTGNTILWLFTMLRVIDDYETELLAAGMSASFKTEFDTACGNMADAELQQEYTKRLRLRQTRQRIAELNRLHQYLQRIQKAGAVIFFNNETKRKELE